MSGEEELPPELKSLEAALASLAPRADRLDRDRLLFEAGRASSDHVSAARRPRAVRLAWPAAFAAMTTVAAVLAAMVAVRPPPEVVERIVYVPAEVPGKPAPRAAAGHKEEALPGESRPAPLVAVPGAREFPAPFLAADRGQDNWLSLRREAVDVQSLDRVLAPRDPVPSSSLPMRAAGAPESYRAMLGNLLGARQNGG